LEAEAIRRARKAGAGLGAELGIAARLRPYEAHRWQAANPAQPTLQLDDVSAIPFLIDIAGVEEYQHRGRLRAGNDDVYVTVTPAVDGYEEYCRDVLQLGDPQHFIADPVGPPIHVALACAHGPTRVRLAKIAKSAGGLIIHPYMGIEDVWELAAMISRDSGTVVQVVASPPPVTWIANDKAVFSELVARVLGRQALVETRVARDAETLTNDLCTLARRYSQVGLKRTRCASAMGNAVFGAKQVRAKQDASRAVTEFLRRTQWPGGEEVLAVAWLETDLSPSTQLWIPALGAGQPRLDGIYEQILEGEHKVFVGSRPSGLPRRVNEALASSAILVASALQELGYVGRCSFDHLVTGDPRGEFEVLLTECNGRWGGTSTPMSLLDRMWQGPRPPYRAQDVIFLELVGARLSDLLEMVGELLFRAESKQGRFIFYNLGPLAKHGKFDVISIGTDQTDAERGLMELLPQRLGS
jgi:hypothetical protein